MIRNVDVLLRGVIFFPLLLSFSDLVQLYWRVLLFFSSSKKLSAQLFPISPFLSRISTQVWCWCYSFSGLLPGVGVCPWWCHICRQGPKCPKSSKILSSSQQDVCYIHPRTAYTSSHKKDPLLRGKWLLVLLLGVTASEISTSHKIMKQQEWSKTQRAIQMLHICTDNEC